MIWVENDRVIISSSSSNAGYGMSLDIKDIELKDILKLLYCKIATLVRKAK